MSSELLIEKLKQSEKELKDIFDAAPIGLALIRKRILINVNDMFCKMLGYTAKELIGQTTEICYKDKAEFKRVGKLLYEQIIVKGKGSLEVKGLRKDGTVIDVLISTANIKDSKTEDDIVFAVLDITKRKRAEKELKKAKDFTDNLIQTANVLIISLDIKGEIIIFNPAAEKITGYTRSELENKNWFETLVPKSKYPYVYDEFNRISKGGMPESFTNPILTKDGQEKIITWSNNTLDNNGDIIGTISFGIDITKLKQTKESLKLTQTAIDKSADSIFWVKPDGNFGYVNDEACKVLGYSREELFSISVSDIDLNYPSEKYRELWAELKTQKTFLIESQLITKSGKVIPVEIRLNYIKYGHDEYMFAFARDISKRKKADKELRTAHDKLRSEQQSLYEKNVALKQVLNFMEKEKTDFKIEISSNIEQALMPFIKKLHKNNGNLSHKDIEALEDAIKTIVGHEIDDFNTNYAKLTSREMDICELIKEGNSSQEIADTLNLSVQTIQKHRTSIREKLQLKNKDINLPAYLRTK